MKLKVSEIIGILLILAALSLGFLSATPTTSSHLTQISTNAISKYLSGNWILNYEYVGTGYYSKLSSLQIQYKNSQVVFENLTDSLGDQLIIVYVYPYHGSNTVNVNGYTVYLTISKNNAFLTISYIGNSTLVSINQLQALAQYIINTE